MTVKKHRSGQFKAAPASSNPYCAPEIIEDEDDFSINDDDDLSEVVGDSRLRFREHDDAGERGKARWH